MEAFDIKKLITAPINPVFWVKVVVIGLAFCFLVLDGYAVYKAYFKKPGATTTQTGNIKNYNYDVHPIFGCSGMIRGQIK